MAYETILYDVTDGVARLTFNRPERLNAINVAMHGEIGEAIDRAVAAPSVRCLLITGTGRGFCAGQDLTDRKSSGKDASAPDLRESIGRYYNPLIRRLAGLDMPIVCAVNGVAAGAGANIAFACDIVIAARSARFIQSFAKIGLMPDSGGTWILPRIAGQARAMGLAMTGAPLCAEKAEKWGMIWSCVDDERLADEAVAMATGLAAGPPLALKAIRHGGHDLDSQLDHERDLIGSLGRSLDYREGVAAFIEKRRPHFAGA